MPDRLLLVLNTGSSSVKFRLFALEKSLPLIAGGKITDIGNTPVFKANIEGSNAHNVALPAGISHDNAVRVILEWLESEGITSSNIAATAHRIVHGGERYAEPEVLDSAAIEYLRGLNALAPLHQPHNLAGVEIFAKEMPDIQHYGCFDTAFHAATQDELHTTFALPEHIRAQQVRRYGFHGLSYEWVEHCLKTDYPHLLNGRVVAAHLGNGASLCAIKNGKSLDTTMGMTALDGLPMGTRCGSIDAGAILYMLDNLGLSSTDISEILYEESGLKGLSGITNDVKALSESDDPRAAFALDYFCLRTAQHIGAMAVSLGGMDALIFTGGIGENAAGIRTKILKHLSFMPPFEHHVIAANEERSMAQSLLDHHGEYLL